MLRTESATMFARTSPHCVSASNTDRRRDQGKTFLKIHKLAEECQSIRECSIRILKS